MNSAKVLTLAAVAPLAVGFTPTMGILGFPKKVISKITGGGKQNFLEAKPYYDQTNVPVNTYKVKVRARYSASNRCCCCCCFCRRSSSSSSSSLPPPPPLPTTAAVTMATPLETAASAVASTHWRLQLQLPPPPPPPPPLLLLMDWRDLRPP